MWLQHWGMGILKIHRQNSYNFLYDLGYTQMQISKSAHICLLSECRYAKQLKKMDTDFTWEIHDRLIDEHFRGVQLNLAEGRTGGTPGVIESVTPHSRVSTIWWGWVQRIKVKNYSFGFLDCIQTSYRPSSVKNIDS